MMNEMTTQQQKKGVATVDDAVIFLESQGFTAKENPYKWEVFRLDGANDVLLFSDDREFIAWVQQQAQQSKPVLALPRRIP